MSTHFSMPKLTDICLYTLMYGDDDWHCTWAPDELGKMLCVGRLRRLHYVFMGEKVAKALRTIPQSHACFERLFDEGLPGRGTASNKFELRFPAPGMDEPIPTTSKEHERLRRRTLKWFEHHDRYVKAHDKLFGWKWRDRNISMGS